MIGGFESDFGINHLGHFALFQELKACLLKSSTPSFNTRVVMVASIGHRMSEIHFDDPNFERRPWVSPISRSTTSYIECLASCLLPIYNLGVNSSQDIVSTPYSTLLGNTNPRFWFRMSSQHMVRVRRQISTWLIIATEHMVARGCMLGHFSQEESLLI
jgi:hypothetical protein